MLRGVLNSQSNDAQHPFLNNHGLQWTFADHSCISFVTPVHGLAPREARRVFLAAT